MSEATVYIGDCREVLPRLESGSVNCCVTSPPYWGLRDYGTGEWEGGDVECGHRASGERRQLPHGDGRAYDGYAEERTLLPGVGATFRSVCRLCGAVRVDRQIGLEDELESYVSELVGVFREVRRVLRDDGTVWLNLGDSYHGGGYANHAVNGSEWLAAHGGDRRRSRQQDRIRDNPGLKPKDLCGVPWRVAFALQADGWYLRSDIIWHKPNPMPESVTDRPTKAHEYIFLLAKQPRYYYDHEAIAEEASTEPTVRDKSAEGYQADYANGERFSAGARVYGANGRRNKRSVWTVSPKPYPEAHFATYPPELIEPCVLAGCPPDGTVIDPFAGSGTTLDVAVNRGRNAIGIELNHDYVELIKKRLGLFLEVAAIGE